jgi:transcription initiation factor TFIIIB Brf1 subunit/transcription initiation factor TFIIB
MSQEPPCCENYSPNTEVIDHRTGDRICTACGRVIEALMMVGTYEDVERTHEIQEFGPSVTFDRVRGVQKSTMAQVFREDEGARRRVCSGLQFVDQFGSQLHLVQRTVDWAKELMRDSLQKKSLRADAKLRCRAAACLYFGCKIDGVDRGENEVADALALPRKDLQTSNKQLRKLLADKPYARSMLQGVRPLSLIPRLMQAVGELLPREVRQTVNWHATRVEVETLARQVERQCSLEGKKPQSVCAALLVKVMEPWGLTSTGIAPVCGVSVGAVESALAHVKSLDDPKKI